RHWYFINQGKILIVNTNETTLNEANTLTYKAVFQHRINQYSKLCKERNFYILDEIKTCFKFHDNKTKCNSSKYLQFNIFFFILFILIGLSCVICGLCILIYPYSYGLYSIMKNSLADYLMFTNLIMLIIFGCLISAFGICGTIGSAKNYDNLMYIFCLGMMISAIGFISITFTSTHFRRELHEKLVNGMTQQVQHLVRENDNWKDIWDYVQARNKCCGSTGAADYEDSQWKMDNLKQINKSETFQNQEEMIKTVPRSCCVLISNEDEYIYYLDINKINPRNLYRCQLDAKGRLSTSSYYHTRGCFESTLEAILLHTTLIISFTVLYACAMICGFVLGVWNIIRHKKKDYEIE
ncbi:hypothetical protein A3Q56_06803, partial [Intoshia linei]